MLNVVTVTHHNDPTPVLRELRTTYREFSYLLWWDFKGLSPHVHFLVDIHTGDDEEDPGPPGSSCQQSAQSEDDGSLVLLDHLHHEEEGEREGEDDEDEGEDSHGHSAQSRALLAP